jgi:hypothetical protein
VIAYADDLMILTKGKTQVEVENYANIETQSFENYANIETQSFQSGPQIIK